ncbi:Protein kinase-like domain protein [Apiospora arundinis]|uniref:Protein kinase-like domain protein n=1 Tax=Apiospora arundinis TaxID=335852 RepID=A0ABR2I8A0_9PEZI
MPEQTVTPSPIENKIPEMMPVEHNNSRWRWKEHFARFISAKARTHNPGRGKTTCKPTMPTPRVSPVVIGLADEARSTVSDDRSMPEAREKSQGAPPEDPSGGSNVAYATERAQELSRSSPTSSTSPTSEPSALGGPNTPARSYVTSMTSTPTVEEPEAYQVNKGVFVAPKRRIPEYHIDKWNTIQPRLEDVLLNLFKPKAGLDPSLSLEFVMAGPSKTCVKPSIVMTCCNETHRKRIKKLLKSQEWLVSSGYSLVVIVDPIHQLSLVSRHNEMSWENLLREQVMLSIILVLCGYLLLAALRKLLEHDVTTIYHHIVAHFTVFLLSCLIAVTIPSLVSSWSRIGQYLFLNEWPRLPQDGKSYNRGLSSHLQQFMYSTGRNRETSYTSTTDPTDPRGSRSPSDRGLNGKSAIALDKETPPERDSRLIVYTHSSIPEGCTACGASAFVHDTSLEHACFTIGGTILIDGSVYGLTAGHPFERPARADLAPGENPLQLAGGSDAESSPEGVEPGSNSDSDSDSDAESASPWVFLHRDDDEDITEILSTPYQSGNDTDDSCYSSNISSLSVPSLESQDQRHPASKRIHKGEMVGKVRRFDYENNNQAQDIGRLDWALIKLDDTQSWAANKESTLGGEIAQVADTTQLEDGEVTIIAGYTGLSKGWLKQSPIMLRVGGHTYQAQQIVLDDRLVRGDSGAWVVRDGMLCGHIIAQRSLSPIAYMLPARSIIEDIKRVTGKSNVRLPSSSDAETKMASTCDTPTDTANQAQEEPDLSTAVKLADPQPAEITLHNDDEDGSEELKELATAIDEGYGGYQVVELYSACRCLYYQHAIKRGPRYGLPGVSIKRKIILVGYACSTHGGQ